MRHICMTSMGGRLTCWNEIGRCVPGGIAADRGKPQTITASYTMSGLLFFVLPGKRKADEVEVDRKANWDLWGDRVSFVAGTYSSYGNSLSLRSRLFKPFANPAPSGREPLADFCCDTEQAATERVVPAASRDRSGERRTNKQRKSQEMVRPREAHAGSITPLKDYYVGAGGVQRAFAHHVSPVGTSPKAKMMGKR